MDHHHHQQQSSTKTKTPASTIPTASPPSPTSPRLLDINLKSSAQRNFSITDSQNRTLYTVKFNSGGMLSSKPHIKVFINATRSILGTVTFHSVSDHIDLSVYGQPIDFKCDGVWKGNHSFVSKVTGGRFRWKMEGGFLSTDDVVCLDERKGMVARLSTTKWSSSKAGKFEFVKGLEAELMDEVVVSGVAMLGMLRKQSDSLGGSTANIAALGANITNVGSALTG